MKYNLTTAQALRLFEALDEDIYFDLHNNYCEFNHYYDDLIYRNDGEFFEMSFPMNTGDDVINVLRRTFYGDYNPNHEYVVFDGYANLISSDFLHEKFLPLLIVEVLDYALNDVATEEIIDLYNELFEGV